MLQYGFLADGQLIFKAESRSAKMASEQEQPARAEALFEIVLSDPRVAPTAVEGYKHVLVDFTFDHTSLTDLVCIQCDFPEYI